MISNPKNKIDGEQGIRIQIYDPVSKKSVGLTVKNFTIQELKTQIRFFLNAYAEAGRDPMKILIDRRTKHGRLRRRS